MASGGNNLAAGLADYKWEGEREREGVNLVWLVQGEKCGENLRNCKIAFVISSFIKSKTFCILSHADLKRAALWSFRTTKLWYFPFFCLSLSSENTQVVYVRGCVWSFVSSREIVVHWQAAFQQNTSCRETMTEAVTLLPSSPCTSEETSSLPPVEEALTVEIFWGMRRFLGDRCVEMDGLVCFLFFSLCLSWQQKIY